MSVLANQSKKYIPIKHTISAFSCFPSTCEALYISEGDLYLLNLETEKSTKLATHKDTKFSKVICLTQNKFILLAAHPATVYTGTVAENTVIFDTQTTLALGFPTSLSASYDGSVIVVGDDAMLAVVRSGTCSYVHGRKEHRFWATTVSDDGTLIAAAADDRITILETSSFVELKKMDVEFIPLCLKFSPDNTQIVYGDDGANLMSIGIASNFKTTYENVYCSKPIYLRWLDSDKQFVCSFLSSSVATYTAGIPTARTMELSDFSSRYFQHADLADAKTLAVCVEDLRNEVYKVEGIPTSDVVAVVKLAD